MFYKILIIFVFIITFTILGLITFLFYIQINDYKPVARDLLPIYGGTVEKVYPSDTLRLISWNIGYAGLGKSMDFFYDGGKKVITKKADYEENLEGIKDFLKATGPVDFYLFQEVDINARRSYQDDQMKRLRKVLPNYSDVFAINYKVKFVPLPLNKPMGHVHSGLCIFSFTDPFESCRISFEGNFSWPHGLFMPDRCYIVNKYYTSDGHELIIINTHNSAFDNGNLRTAQLEALRTKMVEEYSKGNYVIAGGDWNMNPPGFDSEVFLNYPGFCVMTIPGTEFMPQGWTIAYDTNCPTNRKLDQPFKKEVTPGTIIDFFVLSPNIELLNIYTQDLSFHHSDHHPVILDAALKTTKAMH